MVRLINSEQMKLLGEKVRVEWQGQFLLYYCHTCLQQVQRYSCAPVSLKPDLFDPDLFKSKSIT